MAHPVIAYIDGFNLYHGLREKGWKWAYWLNLQALMRVADGYQYIGRDKLSRSQFPDGVVKPDGFKLQRPPSWR
jgi:hypothetical protein